MKQTNFQYVLFPGKPKQSSDYLDKHNVFFKSWTKFWNEFMDESGAKHISNDLLARQDIVACLFDGDKLAGSHLYTLFDIRAESNRNNPFFSSFSEDTWSYLNNKGVRTVMTAEFLHVAEDYRNRETKLRLGDVLMGLGARILKGSIADCGVGVSRSKVNVDKMAERIGTHHEQKGIVKLNHECILQLVLKEQIKPFAVKEIRDFMDGLWDNKLNFSGFEINDVQEEFKLTA